MKILADKEVRQYELTFLLPGELTSVELKKIQESLFELVTKHKGAVVSQSEWGKKELAYTIKHTGKKHTQAEYFHWVVEFAPVRVTAFEQDLRLRSDLLRYLLVTARQEVTINTEKYSNNELEEKE